MRIVSVLLLCFITMPLSALNARSGAILDGQKRVGYSLSPFVSVMTGFSDELVFDSSSAPYPYLSQLHWEINPAFIAGVSGSVNVGNVLFFNAAVGSTLNSSTGEMFDKDWIEDYFGTVDTEWTHYSLSDIYLTSSLLVDYNTALRLYRSRVYTLEILTGFKLIRWGWTDTLKKIEYPTGNYDSLIGYSGIDYDIEYRIPYVGFSSSLQKGEFASGITLKYSWMVSADDHDYHKLRGLHFYDSFSKGRYYGLSLFTRKHWSPVFSLALSFDIDYVPVIQGDTATYSRTGSLLSYSPGGAGVSYMTSAAALSLEYNY